MIDRQGRKIVFECDCCPQTFKADTDDFDEAWAAAKADGWRTKRIALEYLHSCGAMKCKL